MDENVKKDLANKIKNILRLEGFDVCCKSDLEILDMTDQIVETVIHINN